MAELKKKIDAYKHLIEKIIDKLPSDEDKEFIKTNMNTIITNLMQFSSYVTYIVNVSSEEIPLKEKLKKITKKRIFDNPLSLDQAREVMDKLYKQFNVKNKKLFQKGGAVKKLMEMNIESGEAEEYFKTWAIKNKKPQNGQFILAWLADQNANEANATVFANTFCTQDPSGTRNWCNQNDDDQQQNIKQKYNDLIKRMKEKEVVGGVAGLLSVPTDDKEEKAFWNELGKSLSQLSTDAHKAEVVVSENVNIEQEGLKETNTKIKQIREDIEHMEANQRQLNKDGKVFAQDDLAKLQENKLLLEKLTSSKTIEGKKIEEKAMASLKSGLMKNFMKKTKDPLKEVGPERLAEILAGAAVKTDSNPNIAQKLRKQMRDEVREESDKDIAGKLDKVNAKKLEQQMSVSDVISDLDDPEAEREDDFSDEIETIKDSIQDPKQREAFDAVLKQAKKIGSEHGLNQVVKSTQEDTKAINDKQAKLAKDNPQCKMPKYAINPIQIASLKKMRQNVDQSVGFCFSNLTLLASKLFSSFPKYASLIISKWFSDLAQLYNFDWHDFADFSRKLDWVYVYLFVMSSVPVLGFWSDLLIIFRAIKEGRGFLSILTFITTLISLFTLHIVDFGMIIKLLYFLDVVSYNSAKYDGEKPSRGDVNVINQIPGIPDLATQKGLTGILGSQKKREGPGFMDSIKNMFDKLPDPGDPISNDEICGSIRNKLKRFIPNNVNEQTSHEILDAAMRSGKDQNKCDYLKSLESLINLIIEADLHPGEPGSGEPGSGEPGPDEPDEPEQPFVPVDLSKQSYIRLDTHKNQTIDGKKSTDLLPDGRQITGECDDDDNGNDLKMYDRQFNRIMHGGASAAHSDHGEAVEELVEAPPEGADETEAHAREEPWKQYIMRRCTPGTGDQLFGEHNFNDIDACMRFAMEEPKVTISAAAASSSVPESMGAQLLKYATQSQNKSATVTQESESGDIEGEEFDPNNVKTYEEDFGREHQQKEAFRPCDPGEDCSTNYHGTAFKPNMNKNICEKVVLTTPGNLFGVSPSRDPRPNEFKIGMSPKATSKAKKKCETALNDRLKSDLDIDPDSEDSGTLEYIVKYINHIRKQKNDIVGDFSKIKNDWKAGEQINKNFAPQPSKSSGKQFGTIGCSGGITSTDKCVLKCIPENYTIAGAKPKTVKRGKCKWAPSGRNPPDNGSVQWKPGGEKFPNTPKGLASCNELCGQAIEDNKANGKVDELSGRIQSLEKLIKDRTKLQEAVQIIQDDDEYNSAVPPLHTGEDTRETLPKKSIFSRFKKTPGIDLGKQAYKGTVNSAINAPAKAMAVLTKKRGPGYVLKRAAEAEARKTQPNSRYDGVNTILELGANDAQLGNHGTEAIMAGTRGIASAAKSGVSALGGPFLNL